MGAIKEHFHDEIERKQRESDCMIANLRVLGGVIFLLFCLLLGIVASGQDTLITPKGKYILKDAYYTPDTSFMFAASITRLVRTPAFDSAQSPCKQVGGWDNSKFSKVLNADADFVNYTVAVRFGSAAGG
jgi:hypothetical protein